MKLVTMTRWAVILVCGALAAAVSTTAARAAERSASERLAAVKARMVEHRRAKDAAGELGDIRALVGLYEDAARAADVRRQVVRLLGALTRSGKDGDVVVAALQALGKVADPAGTRYVAASLRRMRPHKSTTAALRAAVAAAAQIRSDGLVDPLLKIVTQSKDFKLASAAMQSLGHFGHSKRWRERILRTLVETTAKDKPGLKGRRKGYLEGDQYRHTGDLARKRWSALSRVLPAALTRLTGNDVSGATADTWIDLVTEHKRRLGALFVARP